MSKTCSKCKQSKPLSEFRKNPNHKDKRQSQCKFCQKQCDKLYRQTEDYKKSQRQYQKSKKGKIVRFQIGQRTRKKYPERIKARHFVNHAIEKDELKSPNKFKCVYCGKQAEQYHHWHGYEPEHWLDVVPSCRSCDRKIHKSAPSLF
jgi:hypothetical protein